VQFPNANAASNAFIEPEILADETIYPSAEAKAGLWTLRPYDSRTDRIVTRLWTRVRTGQ
jgi:putrescine transport system substrate-binding protein